MNPEYDLQQALLSNNFGLFNKELATNQQPLTWGNGITILHYFIQNSEKIMLPHNEVVSEIINAGVPIDTPNNDGYTALHFAVSSSKPDLIQLLIEMGANVNYKSKSGNTPLWRAFMDFRCIDSQRTSIRILLRSGADLTLPNNSNISPLLMLERMKGDKYNEEKFNSLIDLINEEVN